MAKTRAANPQEALEAIGQMNEMILGARSELELDRLKSAGTLAVAAAVRAVDLICDAALGRHSVSPSHIAAIDLLATVPASESLVEDFSLCQTRKSDYNYHVAEVASLEVRDALEAAERLASDAQRRLREKGWLTGQEA